MFPRGGGALIGGVVWWDAKANPLIDIFNGYWNLIRCDSKLLWAIWFLTSHPFLFRYSLSPHFFMCLTVYPSFLLSRQFLFRSRHAVYTSTGVFFNT